MMLWWKELALLKLVAQKNPNDLVVWLDSKVSIPTPELQSSYAVNAIRGIGVYITGYSTSLAEFPRM